MHTCGIDGRTGAGEALTRRARSEQPSLSSEKKPNRYLEESWQPHSFTLSTKPPHSPVPGARRGVHPPEPRRLDLARLSIRFRGLQRFLRNARSCLDPSHGRDGMLLPQPMRRFRPEGGIDPAPSISDCGRPLRRGTGVPNREDRGAAMPCRDPPRVGCAASRESTGRYLRRGCHALACPPGLLGLRDRAMLLAGFAGAFRRSELVALEVED
jgi:hypothetical protein